MPSGPTFCKIYPGVLGTVDATITGSYIDPETGQETQVLITTRIPGGVTEKQILQQLAFALTYEPGQNNYEEAMQLLAALDEGEFEIETGGF